MLRHTRLPLIALACALGTQAAAQAPRNSREAAPQSPIVGEIETFTEARSVTPAEGVVFINDGEPAPAIDAPSNAFVAPSEAYETVPTEGFEIDDPAPEPADGVGESPEKAAAPMWQPEAEDLTASAPAPVQRFSMNGSAGSSINAGLPPLTPTGEADTAQIGGSAIVIAPGTGGPPKARGVLEGIQLYLVGDYTGALPILHQNAISGDPRSRQLYGIALFNGEGTPADRAAGIAWTRIAADSGVDAARGNLASMEAAATPAERAQSAVVYRSLKRDASSITPAHGAKSVTTQQTPAAPHPAAVSKPKPAAAPKPTTAPVRQATAAARPQTVSKTGNWKLLLGAFANPTNATSLQSRLRSRRETKGYRITTGPFGKLTSVVATGYSESAARNACASLKAAGYACVPSAG